MNECYIDLTLDKLRVLDSDRTAQEKYIMSRSKFLDRGLINVLIIKLRIESGQGLEKEDYDYINSLLQWERNDIYAMPILEFGKGFDSTARVNHYDDFVTEMLGQKPSWFKDDVNVGMSVPSFYPRRPINNLFRLYGDEHPTFVAVDFNNSRMDKPDGIVSTILSHFLKEKEDNTFMYGVNVKPYKKGAEISSAWDVYTIHGAFNAIGPTHSKPHSIVVSGDWSSMGRIFDSDNLTYLKMDGAHRDSFIYWISDSYGIELHPEFGKNDKSLYSYLKRYNFEMINRKLSEISKAINDGDEGYLKDVKSQMPEEMKNKKIIVR
ncbi:MAG: hypothetical protein LBJ20_02285 [Candidatus Methanoplasma sp.]|nr:hypothetical protein [Candidatus Methanoplasma sp.]